LKYLGNKTRLAEFLSDVMNLQSRKGQKSLDLFAGTGAVSFLFKSHNMNTVSNDLLSFSSHRVRSILRDREPVRIQKLETKKMQGFITENYSEKIDVNIFKMNIAEHIDGARIHLDNIKHNLTEQEFSYYLSQIIEAADFRSNIMGSYESFYKAGWRKQCEKAWSIEDFKLIDNQGKTTHKVFNKEALDFLKAADEFYDLIYLDPPYNTRQYSSVFHVLETISTYDNPEVSGKVKKSVELKKKNSNLCSKVRCLQHFQNIIEESSKKTNDIFISYSNEGILDIQQIETILYSFFKHVSIKEYEYRKFKTNSRKPNNNNKVKEYLINGKK
tara:strand:+ start:1354 stop:2340 length:987 start_codon:yes stop_codon:yes gene_type:complete